MSYPFYNGTRRPDETNRLPLKSRRATALAPEAYIADPDLIAATNVALALGQPLLLTGEPGTGKTQFANHLAWALGLPDQPLKFETRSTHVSRDLFYTYDALRRFQDAQTQVRAENALPYLTYNALGIAILRTRRPEEVAPYLPPGFEHGGVRRSLVLIDEVDKAPRDFPNDMLNEIEQLYFRVPELGNAQIDMDPDLQPIIIITSNSEKDLPDAFLRRCVYYHIPFPDPERLRKIVTARFQHIPDLDTFLELFGDLRDLANGLRKRPATAELIGWLQVLAELRRGAGKTAATQLPIEQTLGSLVKTSDDLARAREVVQQWKQK